MVVPITPAAKTPSVTREQGVTVIALGTEYENLSDSELDELKTVLVDAVSRAEPPLIVLNLSHLRFFGSAFIEALFRAWNQLNVRPGAKFCLSGLSSHCREVVEITHLDQLWPIFPTWEEAVEALRST